jgi:hypothetical protein
VDIRRAQVGLVNRASRSRYNSTEAVMKGNKFVDGDRVLISDDFFWARGAIGTISKPPDVITKLSGPWDGGLTRREKSALGTNTVYSVWFDEPQYDANCDGPYQGGSIWESALKFLKPQFS